MSDKIVLYKRVYIFSNIALWTGVLILLVYITAPLFGGVFLVSPLIYYPIWIIAALYLKIKTKKKIREVT